MAIIGLSCRVPGANSAAEFWKNMCDGVESVTFFSDSELLAAGVDPQLLANPNYVKAAPKLRDIETFDAAFFGYSPKDAALMDPQQRLFLEVCWEAFEDAGYDPATYPGKVGVLSAAGGVVSSYLLAKLHHEELPGQTASISHINNDKDFLSTRVAFKFNLKGPSFTIQSACSSSLVAIHQACQNLRIGECDMMLAGGSVVRVPQVDGYLAEKRNLHSLDGHCRPFDAVGQGTIFGSGVGAILLKPLDQAIADRDHIYAVIKATAANNDGSAKTSYTAPSLGQQSKAVADALDLAGASPDSMGYVECHSTGTIVGDPLEIEALSMAFRQRTERKQFCAIGSVKANIGHPEQAAGIIGIIKTALVLHHKKIPPSINFDTPNPSIDFAASPFFVNTKLRDFPAAEATLRRAGLNSLGIGGTNVFAVLEEAPPVVADAEAVEGRPYLVTLSAKSAAALTARVEQLLAWLNANPDAPLGDLCYTTNISRSQFAYRFAAPARSVADLKARLTAWLQSAKGEVSKPKQERTPVAFMFSGQGSQHGGMTAQLYATQPVFRDALDRCAALARSELEHDLLDVIFARGVDEALVNRTDYTQPALFAVEYALAELLKSWNIVPDAVIGHSLGEIAAACVANVMSLDDAMRLAIARGKLMHGLPAGGAMIAVMAEDSVVRPVIEEVAPGIAIAAMNGPLNTVVSGDKDALQTLTAELDRRGMTYRELRISNGFHSPRTEPILDELENVAAGITHRPPEIPVISNLTGEVMSEAPDKTYWRRHMREGVRFGEGMLALSESVSGIYLEVGPHPVLLPMAQACLQAVGKSATWMSTLNRKQTDAEAIADMLVALYLAGHKIDWAAVHAGAPWRRISLPTYPFQRKRHWLDDAPGSIAPRTRPSAAVEEPHPLLGAPSQTAHEGAQFEARYGVRHIPYLTDHRVAGTIVLPTTVELESALAAGRKYFATSDVSVDDALHHEAMPIADSEDRIVRVSVNPLSAGRASFKIASAAAESAQNWRTHMTGTLRKSDPSAEPVASAGQLRERCPHAVPAADLYAHLAALGLEYGPGFRGITEVYAGQNEALTKIRLPNGLADPRYALHPAFLDACLHGYPLVLATHANGNGHGDERGTYLPVSLERYRCYRDGIDQAWVHTRLRGVGHNGVQIIDIHAYDDVGRPVASLEGLAVRQLPLDKVRAPQAQLQPRFYQVAWRKSHRARNAERRNPASWMIFADAKGLGAALAGRLEAAGERCHLVYRGDALVRQGPRTWTVNERQPQDVRLLMEQFAAAEARPCEGVLYLWSLDAPQISDLSLAGLRSASEMMCRGALAVLHALAETRLNAGARRRLWFVTANTQGAGASQQDIDPVQAPLWGLGRTIAIEYPGLWGGLIDLPLNGRAPDIDLLMSELLAPDGETQIALSTSGERHVARFIDTPLSEFPAQALRIRSDATYLITGGLGMLGRVATRWLIGQGAKHIVLTGRQATPQSAQQLFGTTELNGATIHVAACDISREDDVAGLVQWIGTELPPLRGVVHSAGVLDDGILAQLDWERFEPLFAPRVYGSWLLHHYTQAFALDFFIVNSSLLSLLGSAGQANYTASAAFLDSLTAHRRAAGMCGTAINWCAWSGGGLATVSGARGEAMWEQLGHAFISPEAGTRAFDKIMQHAVDQIAIAAADWPVYADKLGHPPFLSELAGKIAPSERQQPFARPATPDTSARAVAADSPAPVSADIRRQFLGRLQQHITTKLGFTEPIDPDQPLNDLGVDSLMSVTLSNSLESEFGTPVPVAEIIKGPTINELVDSVFQELLLRTPPSSVHDQANGKGNGHAAPPPVKEPRPIIPAAASSAASNMNVRSSDVRSAAMSPPPPIVRAASGNGASLTGNGASHAGNGHAPSNGLDRTRLFDHLQRRIMEELGFTDEIDPDQPLNEVGLDSLRSVALSNRLEKDFGVPVPVAELIAGPSIRQLSDLVASALSRTGQHPPMLMAATEARPAEREAAPPPPIVFEVAGTTGSKGLDLRLGADFAPDANTPRQFGAIAGGRAERDRNGGNGVQHGAPQIAAGFVGDGRNGGASHVVEPQPGQRVETRSVQRDSAPPPRTSGKWLIAPQPNPNAAVRLFCFPYAGGGVASFRGWPQLAHDALEIVAIEPPGRGTRINEAAVEDIDSFVEGLMPELIEWLDRPSAFFGHCLGGLTMFATLCALPDAATKFIKYAFACGIRPPNRLKRRGRFEDNLAYRMMLHPAFNIRIPPYEQDDELFADIVRQFDTPAADRMLAIQKLRKLLLPAIRSEFGMAYNYRYRPVAPFRFPIASFVGTSDPWVSVEDSAAWGDFTRGPFKNHVREGSHFLMIDDQDYILDTINRDFVAATLRRTTLQ